MCLEQLVVTGYMSMSFTLIKRTRKEEVPGKIKSSGLPVLSSRCLLGIQAEISSKLE